MGVNLSTFVGLYSKGLTTLDHMLDKGAEKIAQSDVPDNMLSWRLIDDMNPLSFQAYVVINFAKQWTARAAGLDVPPDIASDLDLAGLKAEIAKAQEFLAKLDPKCFEGREDTPITLAIGPGMEPTLPAAQWLRVFATNNFYFHLNMAYAILRQHGVPLGKRDIFAGGL
jgi:uncharacterized protein